MTYDRNARFYGNLRYYVFIYLIFYADIIHLFLKMLFRDLKSIF